jgi:hypothetical protein
MDDTRHGPVRELLLLSYYVKGACRPRYQSSGTLLRLPRVYKLAIDVTVHHRLCVLLASDVTVVKP